MRAISYYTATGFVAVNSNGNSNGLNTDATAELGAAPGFCI